MFSTRVFVRWMNGTCIETPPQKVKGEDEPYVFSFYPDLAVNTDVQGCLQAVIANIKNTLGSMSKFTDRWRKFRGVWKADKVGNSLCILFLKQRKTLHT